MSHDHISIDRYDILPILTLTSLLILHTRRGTCKPSVHVNPALTKIVGVVFIISTFPSWKFNQCKMINIDGIKSSLQSREISCV